MGYITGDKKSVVAKPFIITCPHVPHVPQKKRLSYEKKILCFIRLLESHVDAFNVCCKSHLRYTHTDTQKNFYINV